MRIESYSFGSITIDGTRYDKDVILLRDRVICPWWRQAGGHVYAVGDLEEVIAAGAEVVILGTGNVGLVKVQPETLEAIEKKGARVIRARTSKAVEEFNRLASQGKDVVAALHLTC